MYLRFQCNGRQLQLLLLVAFTGGSIIGIYWHLNQPRYSEISGSTIGEDKPSSNADTTDHLLIPMTSKTRAISVGSLSKERFHRTNTLLQRLATNTQKLRASDDEFDVKTEQQRRKDHLNRACARLGISRTLPSVSDAKTVHFLASDKFNFIFCFVPKVSCTAWKGIMSALYKAFPMSPRLKNTPTSHSGRFLKMSDIMDRQEVVKRWQRYSKVMFTREPLERALSAYLDKFVYGNRSGFERNFGSIMLKRYRNLTVRKITYPLKDKITFVEFIRFITDNGPRSMMTQQTDHWLPISRITSPCQFNYDFIGHYETLQYDAPYVIKLFNLWEHVTFPEVHISKSHERLVKEYANVPADLIYRLVDYYKEDYELFGYSPNTTLDVIFNARL